MRPCFNLHKNGSGCFRKGEIMDESFMTTKEFCEKLKMSSATVYRMISSRMIPAIKVGRYWKIPRSFFEGIAARGL